MKATGTAAEAAKDVARILAVLEDQGLLFVHDAAHPSVTTLLAGGPVKGSWWAHAAGGRIFRALEALEDDGVITAPLLDGKRTLVHASLLPALVAVGSARAAWQTKGLGKSALALLDRISEEGELREVEKVSRVDAKKLAERLLVFSRSEHGEKGAHQTRYESWKHFARRLRVRAIGEAAARTKLAAAAARAGGEVSWS